MIRGVFRRQAPSIALAIHDIHSSESQASADYADSQNPSLRLGKITIKTDGDKIKRIFVGK